MLIEASMLYSSLVKLYKQLEGTTKRLQKTHYLAQFLKIVADEELADVLLLLQGRAVPVWDERVIGIADKSVVKAIVLATGLNAENVEARWKTTGDLGDAAAQCVLVKKQVTLFSEPLMVRKVIDNLQKTASIEGEGTVDRKLQLLAELLTGVTADEARYLIRTFLEDLRIGLGDGSMRNAIVWASFDKELNITYDEQQNDLALDEEQRKKYDAYAQTVQDAYDLTNDFARIALLARKGLSSLKNITLEPGKPCNVMLYQKVKNISEAFETVGKPAAFEYKYDGFHITVHKQNNTIKLFTRRLENVTQQFPDIVSIVATNISGTSFIIDAEIVGIDMTTGKYTPFQNISQRIKRKYDIAATAQKFPAELAAFDILYNDNASLLSIHFSDRRNVLTKIIQSQEKKISIAQQKIITDEKEAEEFYQQALAAGCEGIMIKNLNGIYQPGSRVGYGVKLKPVMETLDVVIVGAEWGEGKRSAWLSSFTVAVRNDHGDLLEIGKVGTGIKEKEDVSRTKFVSTSSDKPSEEGITFNHFTELLKPHILRNEGKNVFVKPTVIIEVAYEEIQQSPTYTSGYALRFPRFVRIRDDKSVTNISTTIDVERLHKEQRGRDN